MLPAAGQVRRTALGDQGTGLGNQGTGFGNHNAPIGEYTNSFYEGEGSSLKASLGHVSEECFRVVSFHEKLVLWAGDVFLTNVLE